MKKLIAVFAVLASTIPALASSHNDNNNGNRQIPRCAGVHNYKHVSAIQNQTAKTFVITLLDGLGIPRTGLQIANETDTASVNRYAAQYPLHLTIGTEFYGGATLYGDGSEQSFQELVKIYFQIETIMNTSFLNNTKSIDDIWDLLIEAQDNQ